MTPENIFNNRSFCRCEACKAAVHSHEKTARDASIHTPENISKQLNRLPEIKASPDFDRKMTARFALELENETARINKAWLQKSRNISLPHLISDLKGELL